MRELRRGTDLEYAGTVRGPPGIQEVVLAGGDKPLATVGELEGQDTALVQMQLVLVRFTAVEDLHIATLHSGKHHTIVYRYKSNYTPSI